MRIIGFSSTVTPSSFWTLPVHALAPWMSRVKHSVGHLIRQAAQGDVHERMQARFCVSSGAPAASNETVFAEPMRQHSAALRAAPLRVIRDSDAALGAECDGRMVISGRMADVCAELDRMALRAAVAQEACITSQP